MVGGIVSRPNSARHKCGPGTVGTRECAFRGPRLTRAFRNRATALPVAARHAAWVCSVLITAPLGTPFPSNHKSVVGLPPGAGTSFQPSSGLGLLGAPFTLCARNSPWNFDRSSLFSRQSSTSKVMKSMWISVSEEVALPCGHSRARHGAQRAILLGWIEGVGSG